MKKIILVLSIFFLTGCYDYHEINDLEIISSIFVDFNDDEYIVTLEVINTEETAEVGSYFVSASGYSIEDALNNTFLSSKKTPYYSHLNALIISESLYENGIDKIFDYFTRDIDIRKDFLVFLLDDFDSFFDYEAKKGESIGLVLYNMTKNAQEKNGLYRTSSFREIIFDYLRDNPYFIGSIKNNNSSLELGDSYVFKNNIIYTKVDDDAILVSNMLDKKNKSFVIIVNNNTYEIYEYKLKFDFDDNSINFLIDGKVKLLNINSASLSDKDILNLESSLNTKIQSLIEDTYKYSINQNCDILNIKYKYYLNYSKCDDQIWKNLNPNIEARLKVSEKGMLLDSLKERKNER